MTSSSIVQRVWNYCNVLRDDGMSYGDYLEQLTYLLFLKMDDENRQIGKASALPDEYNWRSLLARDADALEAHYRATLTELGKGSGLIPVIFRKAQNRVQDPAKLRRLIELIDGETWTGLDIDVKGEIYEGLLEKNAQDTKSGAGQYFTPRPLIKAIVRAERLRQAILKRAFEGKLVAQDPADEPAERLLERVREAEKARPETRNRKPARARKTARA